MTIPSISVKHSGALGDVIYSLPACKALAAACDTKINYLLETDVQVSYGRNLYKPNNLRMDNAGARMLMPLLREQPYINAVAILGEHHYDLDLDNFRRTGINLASGHIARWYFSFMNVNADLALPWIDCDPDDDFKDCIIVNRSLRYRNNNLSYKFLHQYQNIIFVGNEVEYAEWRSSVGVGEWVGISDFLVLAQMLKGCRLFIGNQSLSFAIAEAVKAPRILEVCPYTPNVIPHGAYAWDAWTQQLLEASVKVAIGEEWTQGTQLEESPQSVPNVQTDETMPKYLHGEEQV